MQPTTPQSPPQQISTVPAQANQPVFTGGATTDLATIQAMTPSQFAGYMGGLQNAANPISAVLYDSPVQRMIYDAGINGKPDIVDPSQFRKLKGTTLYRTVNSAYDRSSDVNHPADRIARQTMQSAYNRIGGGVYGDGHYFADSRGRSTVYGNVSGNVSKTAVMSAKLNSRAKIVSARSLERMLSKEPASLRKAMSVPNYKGGSYTSSDNNLTAYALYKGYNVVQMSNGYHIVIDRSALTFSSEISAK